MGDEVKTRTKHKTVIVTKCPANGSIDVYEAEFIADDLLKVEHIQHYIDMIWMTEVYQEYLTESFARDLNCMVRTVGAHGKFSTECVSKPDGLPDGYFE